MRKLLFFSRVAFICNLCFLFTFLMHYIPGLKNGFFISTIVVAGLGLSVVINVILILVYIYLAVSSKPVSYYVPRWLVVTNFLFFIFQAILLVK